MLLAGSDTEFAQSAIRVELPDSPVLNSPNDLTAKAGSPLRFLVSATAADGFPVALSVSQLPSQARFEEATGEFDWTPTSNDLGAHDLIFTATNSVGAVSHKSVHLYIGAGTPEITSLRNAAGPAAVAACTPGSVATLVGRFLFDGDMPVADRSGSTLDLQKTQVSVNGIQRPVLFASPERVDFLCSQDAPGTPLQIALQRGADTSNILKTTMLADAPGILTVNDTGTGQAVAFQSGTSELAALPNPRFQGEPAIAGDLISVVASGIPCDENFSAGRPQLQFGSHVMPVRAIRPAAGYAGACELTFEVPAGIAGDNLMIRLQVMHYDGTTANSNPASIAVGDR
jgi:uncharacterized protein (TIGR03437 family)